MPEPDLIELFVRPLGQWQFRYLIRGDVVAVLAGEPRVTHDIDFVVFLRVTAVAWCRRRLRQAYVRHSCDARRVG